MEFGLERDDSIGSIFDLVPGSRDDFEMTLALRGIPIPKSPDEALMPLFDDAFELAEMSGDGEVTHDDVYRQMKIMFIDSRSTKEDANKDYRKHWSDAAELIELSIGDAPSTEELSGQIAMLAKDEKTDTDDNRAG